MRFLFTLCYQLKRSENQESRGEKREEEKGTGESLCLKVEGLMSASCRAVDSRLCMLLEGLLSQAPINADPELATALDNFRLRPQRFAAVLHATPDCEQASAILILRHMFEELDDVEQLTRKEPMMFDEASLLIKGCECFVAYCHSLATTLHQSLHNVLPSDSSAKASAATTKAAEKPLDLSEIAKRAASLSSSLIRDMDSAKQRLMAVSRDVLSVCAFAVHLEDQSNARLEVQKRLEFLHSELAHLPDDLRLEVGDAVVKEVECRMEYKVVQNFVTFAKKQLGGDNELLRAFYKTWKKVFEERKDLLAERALRMCNKAVDAVNRALTHFTATQGRKPAANNPVACTSGRAATVQNQLSDEDRVREALRQSRLEAELEKKCVHVTPAYFAGIGLACEGESSQSPASSSPPRSVVSIAVRKQPRPLSPPRPSSQASARQTRQRKKMALVTELERARFEQSALELLMDLTRVHDPTNRVGSRTPGGTAGRLASNSLSNANSPPVKAVLSPSAQAVESGGTPLQNTLRTASCTFGSISNETLESAERTMVVHPRTAARAGAAPPTKLR